MSTNTKPSLLFALPVAAVAAWAACAPTTSNPGTPGTAGTTGGSGTGTAGTTGAGTGVAGTTGSGTGVAGTTGSGTGVAGTTGSGTGVAGTTGSGTGVAGTTGAAGAAGAPVPQKLCATKTTVMNPVLINFETYDGTVTADKFAAAFGGATAGMGTAYTGPYSYGDGSVTPTLAIMAGRPPSNWAVAQTAIGARTWGMGGGIWINCADASAYKGITFWVRGMSTLAKFEIALNMESTSPPDPDPRGGGTCPGTCVPPKKIDLALTPDWTQVSLLWADFTPGTSGTTTVVPNGSNIVGIQWNLALPFQEDPSMPDAGVYIGVPGDLVINIDDVSFIP
jgi:hypothetical protein